MPIKIKPHFSVQINEPKMYFVTIINNEFISWEFCVRILMEVFHKNLEDALILTKEIQTNGEALCGVYTSEIAETKAVKVEKEAKKARFTIRCLIETV